MNTRPNFKSQLIKRALIAVAALSTLGAVANSYAASATASGTATVITPIAISKTADLDFGAFSNTGTLGTVVVSTAGARSQTGGVVLSSIDAGNAASFNVTGQASATYTVTLPSSTTITHTVDNTKTMTIDTFASNPSGTSGALSTGGAQTLAVGGTLNVAANQTAGSYAGTFSVSVEYN